MRRLTLRNRMVLLVLAGVLPLLAFNLANVYSDYRQDRVRGGRQALNLARSLAFAVEGELRSRVAALQVLALSVPLAAGDMVAFHAQAKAVVALQEPGANIILAYEDGQQLMNVLQPPGAPLPVRRHMENLRRVLATGLPAVSDLFDGVEMHRLIVSIEVPVHRDDGRIDRVLAMIPTLGAFDKIIRRQKVSEDWLVSILDQTDRRVARVPADERLVGQQAAPDFVRASEGVSEGLVPTISSEGVPVLAAFSRLPEFGWTVTVAVPTGELTEPAWRSAQISLAVGFGLLIIGLALGHLVSRSIVGPISALWHLASAADGTGRPILASTGLREVDEVAGALLAEACRRRVATTELARHVEALERSNNDLDDFAFIASHDLKEPLRGIANNARFLQEDYADKLTQDGVNRLVRVGYLSQRMEQLISDLLHFSRLGQQELAVQLTDLNVVVRDIEMMSETTFKERNATIVIPHALPRISCDKTRITEVLRNLITNAVKYNDNAMKRVEIGYCNEARRNGDVERHVFYVKDNGIGIADEFHEDIFRIFKRLNAEDDDKKGAGVGLTFVRKIVERHGGRVWLDSVPGEGTTFYFTIDQGATYDAGS